MFDIINMTASMMKLVLLVVFSLLSVMWFACQIFLFELGWR